MSSPNYRVHVSFDGERKVFVARVPELPACLGEGATRGEALTNMERELDALVANFADRGARPPVAADDEAVSGELQLQVSRSLHRELLFAARAEGVEPAQLVSELLAAGLEHRQRRTAGRRPSSPEASSESAGNSRGRDAGHDAGRGGRFYDDGGRRGDRNTAARFHGLLEDRASFMEYVRGVEAEGRAPANRGGFGGGDRGRRPPGPGGGRRPEGRDDGRGPRGGGGAGGGGRPGSSD